MNLKRDEIEYLMAYVDGQLDEEEARDVEKEIIATNDEARRLVEQLGAVGQWVRSSAEAGAVAAGADGIADAVMREAESLGGANVILLERGRAKKALNRQRIKEFSTLAAVAAALGLLWFSGPSHPVSPEVVASNGPIVPTHTQPTHIAPALEDNSPQLALGTGKGVDVENVETQHQVSVFYLPAVANDDAASVVVWIGEDQEIH